jgi:hypothetical protein
MSIGRTVSGHPLFCQNIDKTKNKHSQMRQRKLRFPAGVLPTGPDPQRRRAHDEFLQVCQVWDGLAGELILLSFFYFLGGVASRLGEGEGERVEVSSYGCMVRHPLCDRGNEWGVLGFSSIEFMIGWAITTAMAHGVITVMVRRENRL